MIKTKLAISLIFIIMVSFLAGCERLTASVDGLDKQSSETAVDAGEELAEPVEETTANLISGGTVAGLEDNDISNNLENNLEDNLVDDMDEPGSTHTVKMTADGFSPDKLYIKAGDQVIWKNTRQGTISKAMVIGVRECREVRSGFLKPGESFSWTFDQPMVCTLADGVMTTKESKIYVE